MQENEQKQNIEPAQAEQSDLSESLSPAPARHYAKTAGEKIHNEITFRGVDWIANTAFAVGFAYWVNRTAHGQRNFANRSNKIFSVLFEPIAKDSEQLTKWATRGTEFASIVLGGTAIIPPMIALDRNKREMVEYFDRKIYGDEAVENEERFKVRYEAMLQQPKKSFGTGMLARFTVLAPMLWAHVKYNDQMNAGMYQPIAKGSKALVEGIGVQPEYLMKRHFNGSKQSDWNFLHTTFGMDIGLTLIYSFAHEWTYKTLTNLFHGGVSHAQQSLQAPLRVGAPAQPEATLPAGNARASLGQLMQPPATEVAHG